MSFPKKDTTTYVLWFWQPRAMPGKWIEWVSQFATEAGARAEARMERFDERFSAWGIEKRVSTIVHQKGFVA
jgi:hypothetical protein